MTAEQKEDVWILDSIEVSNFYSHFHTLCPSGLLPKTNGKRFFTKLKVPSPSISLLWNLSDVDRDGYLNAAEFCVAMHMAKHHVNGVPLPKALPSKLKQYAKQEIQFVKNDNQKDRCLEIFERCKDHVHEGVLEGKMSKFLLAKSKLKPSQLFHIWNLSDSDKDGGLTLEEFRVAIRLIALAKQGVVLPTTVKAREVLPASFFEDSETKTEKESSTGTQNPQSVTNHRPLPLSPSWANFDDNKLDDFSQQFTPISEEDESVVFSTQTASSDTATIESAFGTATEEQENSSESENPFHKDSFVGTKKELIHKKGTYLEKQDTETSDPFGTDPFGSSASDNHDLEEDNPFHKDSFVGIKEDKDISAPQETTDTKHLGPFNSEESASKEDNPFHTDSFVDFTEDKGINPSEVTTATSDLDSGKVQESFPDSKEDNPLSQDSFVGFTEKEPANFPKTGTQHSDPFNDNLEDTAKAVDSKERITSQERSETSQPSRLETVFEEPTLSDPFLQSDPFSSASVSTTASANPLLANSLPEEEPRSKFQQITPHSELDLANTDLEFTPFQHDPFGEEPFYSESAKTDLQASSEFAAAFDQFNSALNNPPGHLFESSNTLDSANSSFDHQKPTDSLSGNLDQSKPVDHSQPVDSHKEPVSQSEIESHCLDEMAVDITSTPDLQDLDNAFTLDDLSNVIAEMELVSESFEEPPTPPAVEKPQAPPPIATKKYERKPVRTNEQSPKKPESFLNEVNVEKNKTSSQKIDLDIAGDVFSELEAQLQQELSDDAPPGKSADQVPDEVKEVLKELNAPYSLGLEDIETDLGIKSEDSNDNVGDLISQLQGDFDELGEVDEVETLEEDGEVDFEEEDEGLQDQFASSSMDDLLSQLEGMDDKDNSTTLPPPTLPKPSKMAVVDKEELVEDPVLDFDLNVDDELASITNVISNFSDNSQPAADTKQDINYDMTEASYQEALVEHRWKKIEKEQGRRDKEASEVKQLNEESDLALKSLEEEMQSLMMNNQSSNNNTGEVMVLRHAKTSTSKELKSIRRRSSLAEMWEEAVSQRIQQSKKTSSGASISIVKETEETIGRELELQKERELRQQSTSPTNS